MRFAALLAGGLLLAGCVRGAAPDRELTLPLSALYLPAVGPTSYQPSQLRGKVVLINFFSTWCFPCLADLPVLEKLQADFGPQGFTVVAVGMDLEEERVLAPWAEQYAPPFPVLVSNEQLREGTTPFGRIAALPATFVFDRNGELLAGYQGVASPRGLIELVGKAVRQ